MLSYSWPAYKRGSADIGSFQPNSYSKRSYPGKSKIEKLVLLTVGSSTSSKKTKIIPLMLFGKVGKIFGNFGAYTVNKMLSYSNRWLPNFDSTDHDRRSLTDLWLIKRVKTLIFIKKFLNYINFKFIRSLNWRSCGINNRSGRLTGNWRTSIQSIKLRKIWICNWKQFLFLQ